MTFEAATAVLDRTRSYFNFLDRSKKAIKIVETYLKASKQFRNYSDPTQDPTFSKVCIPKDTPDYNLSLFRTTLIWIQVVVLDLSTVIHSVAGPKRPQDRINLNEMKKDFTLCLMNTVSAIQSLTKVTNYSIYDRRLASGVSD